MAWFYILKNLFHVWLNKRQLDSFSASAVDLLQYVGPCSLWKNSTVH